MWKLNSHTSVYLCVDLLSFGLSFSGVSHSVLADMQTIQQETPTLAKVSSHPRKYSDDEEEEDGFLSIRCDPLLAHSYFIVQNCEAGMAVPAYF